jgi:hypothetical protein
LHAIGTSSIGGKSTLLLAFASKSLRDICEDEEQSLRRFGKRVTESLKHRLADLEAAGSPTDLVAGQPHPQNPTGNYIVRLANGFCLEFVANHIKNPVTKNGDTDWKKVNRIKIIGVGKCYE